MRVKKRHVNFIKKLPLQLQIIIVIVFLCVSSLSFFTSFSKDYYVKQVIDGDTIHVVQNGKKIKVRFYGIDAPESQQRYGKYCAKELAKLVQGKNVKLDIKTTDGYGRKVAVVWYDDLDVNKQMVRIGCAWAYTYYTNKYKQDEMYAKKNKLGLWQDKNPQNPYAWRKKHKGK